jgi:hypothetical protein
VRREFSKSGIAFRLTRGSSEPSDEMLGGPRRSARGLAWPGLAIAWPPYSLEELRLEELHKKKVERVSREGCRERLR